MTSISGLAKNFRYLYFFRVHQVSVLALLFCFCTGSSPFQQGSNSKEMDATIQTYWPRGQFTLKADSDLVEVAVVVRDGRGRCIPDLGKEDFLIEDAGRKREITSFSVETFAPMAAQKVNADVPVVAPENIKPKPPLRYVAILLDDINLSRPEQVLVKAAAARFLKEGIADSDRIALITTSGKQIVPFTGDLMRLLAALDHYTSFPRDPGAGFCPKLTAYDAYAISQRIDFEAYQLKKEEFIRCMNPKAPPGRATGIGSFASVPMNDSVLMLAAAVWEQYRILSSRALDTIGRLVAYMRQLPGRRMVLMASSGFLVRTLESDQQNIINHALRSGVVINALDAKGLYTDDLHMDVPNINGDTLMRMMRFSAREKDIRNDIMAILAASTGGLFFHNNNDLNFGFRELGMVPEVSYLLAFSPQDASDGKYHDLKVRLRPRNNYVIQARPGYWATKRRKRPFRKGGLTAKSWNQRR